MKSISKKIFFITFAFVLVFSACKEDEHAEWKILNEEWLNKHKDETGFEETGSGLSYKIINEGIIRNPNASSFIRATYTGKLIDGTTFDSGTYETSLANAIAGWQEGLAKIRTNGKIILYIPSNLGYGKTGSGLKIPPHSTLIFEIELHESIN